MAIWHSVEIEQFFRTYEWQKIYQIFTLCMHRVSKCPRSLTCTPRMPKMMKKVQHMRTMLPMGLSDESKVWTTNFNPGALFITRKGRKARTSLKTLRISKIFDVWPNITEMMVSKRDTITRVPSIMFHPDLK